MNGSGFSIEEMVTLFVVSTSCSLIRTIIPWMRFWRVSGTNKFRWRCLFAPDVLCNRLLRKDNLVRRDIISPEHHFCVSGCGQVESTQHLFLHCDFFGFLWLQVRSWIGIYKCGLELVFPTHLPFPRILKS